jgi:glycosyltransferase involved in cell wall biosynthesis
MSAQRVIALLGRKDEPTDAVEEYCRYLGAALASRNIQMEVERFPWEKIGWPKSFQGLEQSATLWRRQWVLVQYTALAWSSRGFPLKFLRVLKILKSAGCHVGIVFHDVEPFPGTRLVDRLRRATQIRTMQRSLRLADTGIFTVPQEELSWLGDPPSRTAFIPVGPNLPIPAAGIAPSSDAIPTVGVFSITGGEAGVEETKVIIATVRHAAQKLGKLRLSIFGRHAELREAALRHGFRDVPVDLSVEGVVAPEQVVQRLFACDVLLFVRGHISSRRGSAIAAIACGLPVVAYSGSETASPITGAGVLLVPPDRPEELLGALVRVLSDSALRAELSSRSLAAYQQHFSWEAIAGRFADFLGVP